MRVIGLDTSTDTGGVALVEGGRLTGEYTLSLQRTTHSERLLPTVERVLSDAGIEPGDKPDGIAVALGPGSFTGVRIGVVTAKMFSFAWQVPVVGVLTLEALAYQMSGAAPFACPVMDARNGNVFTALYDVRGSFPIPLLPPALRAADTWFATVGEQLAEAMADTAPGSSPDPTSEASSGAAVDSAPKAAPRSAPDAAPRSAPKAAPWSEPDAAPQSAPTAAPGSALGALGTDGPIVFGGDGLFKYWPDIQALVGVRAVRVPPGFEVLRSGAVAMLGAMRLARGERDEAAQLSPIYLRKSEAERKWEARAKKRSPS